jgi:hypothetical protein
VSSHYNVLGIAPGATQDEVKRAYHRRARELHPDIRAGVGGAAMAEVNAAWAVLGNPVRRRAYDRELSLASKAGEATNDPRRRVDLEDVAGEADLAVLLTPDPDPPPRPSDALVLVPVALLAVAAGCLGLAAMTEATVLLLAAVVLFAVATTAFLAAPLVVLRRAVRRRAGGS